MNSSIQNLLNNNSITQLMGLSEDPTIALNEINEIGDALWAKFIREITNNAARQTENSSNKIQFNGYTMKYSVEVIGTKPTDGYPVYICLHGGGGGHPDFAQINDDEWNKMKSYYKGSVQQGIYIAPRGIDNTWNLHFLPASYPIYDRLIENMIVFKDADPNRVYLLGFSTGGDGVYQISARMADRWAASNMSSGHHNSVSMHNLHNLPFNIQVGEYDYLHNRNIEGAKYDALLETLRKEAGDGYEHKTMIHRGGNHYAPWADNKDETSLYTIYDDPAQWLGVWEEQTGNNWEKTAKNLSCKKPGPDPYAVPEGSCITGPTFNKVDTNAVRWVNKYTRKPKPSRVRWDLTTAAPSRNGKADNSTNFFESTQRPNLFYWLDNMGYKPGTDSKIDVQINRDSNTVTFFQFTNQVRLLLSSELLDLSKPIKVVYGTDKFTAIVRPTLKNMVNTLVGRGDKNYMFAANLVLSREGSSIMAGYNCYKLEDIIAGTGGADFSDVEEAAKLAIRLTSLRVDHGDILDGIRATYGGTSLSHHGGSGGVHNTINFDEDEVITGIDGLFGEYYGLNSITQLTITTNKRSYGPYGTHANSSKLKPFSFKAPDNLPIHSFKGKTVKHSNGTEYVSALGVAYSRPKPAEEPLSDFLSANNTVSLETRKQGPYELGLVFSSLVSGKITQVGSKMPEPGTYRVTIWDFDTKQMLRQTSVLQTAADKLAMVDLDSLPLTSNKKYVISINNQTANITYRRAYKTDNSLLMPFIQGNIQIHNACWGTDKVLFPNHFTDIKNEFYGFPEFTFVAN